MENEKFGKFMQQQRLNKNMTQEQIGNILGVTDKAVSRWERGECYPEITQLPNIAEIFEITIDELIKGEAKPQNLLRMCENCKNQKCKTNNYSLLRNCSNSFHWSIFGISVAALFMLITAGYLIVRIFDGNWIDWKLPLILVIIYIVVVVVGALVFSLKDIKAETKANKA